MARRGVVGRQSQFADRFLAGVACGTAFGTAENGFCQRERIRFPNCRRVWPESYPMKPLNQQGEANQSALSDSCASMPAVDILILSDGTILVHNLTPAMAAMLNVINPQDPTIR